MSEIAPFDAVRDLDIDGTTYKMADLRALEEAGLCDLDSLPMSIRILLESMLWKAHGSAITEA